MRLEMGEPMEILFCDLCNESVPEGDLREGRAVRRKGRVVCASCEASMSAHAARASSELAAAPAGGLAASHGQGGPAHAHAHAGAGRPRRSPGLGIALVAFVASIAFPLFLWTTFEEQRVQTLSDIADIRGDLSRLRGDSSRLLAALDRETADLDRRLRQEVDGARRELRAELAELRQSSTELGAQFAAHEARLAELKQASDEGLTENGQRIDEIAAQLQRGKQDAGFVGERLAALEQVVQKGGALGAGSRAPAAEAPPPAWTAALADLASEDPTTRWNAVQSLGDSRDPAVVAHLAPVLHDKDVFVRMAVARVLGDLGAPTAIEPLIDALEDEEATVREMAMVSLRALTGRDFKFDAVASPAERAKKVKTWRQWWEKAKEEYLPDSAE